MNEDIVHNNIRYKSPIPGFKWTLKNKIKKDYENKDSNYTRDDNDSKKLSISSNQCSEIVSNSKSQTTSTWNNLFIMENQASGYRGQGTIVYAGETQDRMFYGNNYRTNDVQFNIAFDKVSRDNLRKVISNNVFTVKSDGNRICTINGTFSITSGTYEGLLFWNGVDNTYMDINKITSTGSDHKIRLHTVGSSILMEETSALGRRVQVILWRLTVILIIFHLRIQNSLIKGRQRLNPFLQHPSL